MPTRRASAVWEGGLQGGKGSFSAGTGLFAGSYSFGSRFQEAPGTNPEELLAAAHAACLSMALSAGLEQAGTPATRVETRAACTVEKVEAGFKITRMELVVRGKVPGMSQAEFQAAAEAAKNGCPVSGALRGNLEFVLDAKLE
jgi:osmotically inducible protein OsmC